MKNFYIKFLVFSVPVIIIYSVIEYKLAHLPGDYVEKKQLFEKQIKKNDIEILLLGASYTLYGINPDSLSHKAFNLAYYSQTIFYDKRLTLKYIDQLPKLKLVIIPIHTFSMYRQLHNEKQEWRDYYYYHIWGIKYKDLPLFDARRYSYIALYTLDQTLKFVRSGFTATHNEFTTSGFAINDSSGHLRRINDSLGKVQADVFNDAFSDLLKKDKDGEEIKYITNDLDEFVNNLKSRNIKVAFITIPVYHTFLDHTDKRLLSMNDSIINNISNKYSFPYHNYFNDSRFTIDDFFDNDHLNVYGAAKFSKIIDSEIIKPAFK